MGFKRFSHCRCSDQSGFTLIELITTLIVAGILLAVAIPNLQNLISGSGLSATTNELVAAMQIARSEAVSRATRVSLCPSTNQLSCTGGRNWEDGWIVFTDLDENGTLNGSDALLRAYGTVEGATIRTGSGSFNDFIGFSTLGSRFAHASNNGDFRICNLAGDTAGAWSVTLSATGHATTGRGVTACPY